MIGWDDRYKEILNEVYELYLKRRVDYQPNPESGGLARSKNIGVDPVLGILIRLQDKFNLLETYVRQNGYESHDESFRETLLDICSYVVLAVITMERSNG